MLERILCSAETFGDLTKKEKINFKWDNCLKPVKIWVIVTKSDTTNDLVTKVLNWNKVSLEELSSNSPTPPVK